MPLPAPINPTQLRARRVVTSYAGAVAITKSDATVYDPPLVALYVTGTGNVNFVDTLGNTTVITGVPANTIIPISMSQVLSTSTTATTLIGLY